MVQTKTLLEVEVVTDTEIGGIHVGEIDFSLHYALDEFLAEHETKGRDEIVNALAHLIHIVWKKETLRGAQQGYSCAQEAEN